MNTLGKEVTKQFFINPETGFTELETFWKAKMNPKDAEGKALPQPKLPAAQHLAYAILRGKDYRKGFAEVTNDMKLKNGTSKDQGLRLAEEELRGMTTQKFVNMFPGIVVTQSIQMVRDLIPVRGNVENRLLTGAYKEVSVILTVPAEKQKVEKASWLTNISTRLFGAT